jgi:hypothetical protein
MGYESLSGGSQERKLGYETLKEKLMGGGSRGFGHSNFGSQLFIIKLGHFTSLHT